VTPTAMCGLIVYERIVSRYSRIAALPSPANLEVQLEIIFVQTLEHRQTSKRNLKATSGFMLDLIVSQMPCNSVKVPDVSEECTASIFRIE
jgi:hypothetical protein